MAKQNLNLKEMEKAWENDYCLPENWDTRALIESLTEKEPVYDFVTSVYAVNFSQLGKQEIIEIEDAVIPFKQAIRQEEGVYIITDTDGKEYELSLVNF